MRDINQIIADNGNDNTPAMDTHNLTGRVVLDPDNAEMPLSTMCNRLRHDEHCADLHWSN